ncbi:MAG: hypothetical protein U0M72_04695 [Eggerthellaceae bacterium]
MDFTPLALLYDVCIISALIVVAKIIRARVSFFQNLFIPTALIAGFLGVILGKYGLNVLPLSSQASSYAGILIAVLFATMYLGKRDKAGFREMFKRVGDTFLLNGAAEIMQYGIALVLGGLLFAFVFPDVISWFAIMMPGGFVGGHGTAAAMGAVFENAGWSEAITIGQTFATFGLLGGIFSGIVAINYCARKGYTTEIKKIGDMPDEYKTGLVPDGKRLPMGENTVSPMSLDPMAWHLSLILVAVGGAYLINEGLKILIPSVSIPIYGIALIVGVLLFSLLKLIKLDSYVDSNVVSRMGSCATDYLVAFGVATINVNVVMQYWQPILILCLLGFAQVIFFFFFFSRHLFKDHWVERGIYIWGWSTGVMSIAVLLLRIVDPEFKTGVLEDSGFAWIFVSFIDIALVTFLPLFVMQGLGLVAGVVLLLIAAVLLGLAAVIYGVFNKNGKKVFPSKSA